MQKCSAFGRQSHEWLIFLIVRHSTVVGSAYINYMYIHINGRMNVIFSFCYSVCFFSALFFIVSLLLLAALTAPTLTMLFGFKLYCKNGGYAMNSWHFFLYSDEPCSGARRYHQCWVAAVVQGHRGLELLNSGKCYFYVQKILSSSFEGEKEEDFNS